MNQWMMEYATKQDGKNKKKNGGAFQSMGLSDEVYNGIVKMGFRVSLIILFCNSFVPSYIGFLI